MESFLCLSRFARDGIRTPSCVLLFLGQLLRSYPLCGRFGFGSHLPSKAEGRFFGFYCHLLLAARIRSELLSSQSRRKALAGCLTLALVGCELPSFCVARFPSKDFSASLSYNAIFGDERFRNPGVSLFLLDTKMRLNPRSGFSFFAIHCALDPRFPLGSLKRHTLCFARGGFLSFIRKASRKAGFRLMTFVCNRGIPPLLCC